MTHEEALCKVKGYLTDIIPTENYSEVEEIIEALEQQPNRDKEPCDAAISRDDRLLDLANAIESDDSGYWTNKRISSALRNIEQLPFVTQKAGKWIPFSERLPKPFEHCLITTTDGEVIYHYDDGHYSKYKAWMPLPKPYEPQESEE